MFSTKLQEGLRGCCSTLGWLCAFVFNRVPVSTEEATPESEEQSGEGSGNSDTFVPFLNMDQQWMRDGPEQETNKNEEEASTWMESSGDIDYSEYVSPEKTENKKILSTQDLLEDDIIA